MVFKVRHVTPEENQQWDELIESSPQGEIFLKSFFLLVWPENDPELHLHRFGCFDHHNKLVGGQAFLHKLKLGVLETQCLLQTWTHIETPVIAADITQGSKEYVEIITALAKKRESSSLYYKIFCHPSIQDVRPFLSSGWNARPDYSHGWDLKNADIVLKDLSKHKRFRNATKVFQSLQFNCERSEEVINEFIPLYLNTAKNIGYVLRESFERIFRIMKKEMLSQNLLRLVTCRNKNGELLAVATYTINRAKKTAYGCRLAHVPLQGEMDIIPALYLYSIKVLSDEVDFIDIGEGLHPSLYLYKDSLGTVSTPYFVVETPHAVSWLKMIEAVRKSKKKVVSLIR